jgi:hypothetical protein
MLGIDGQTMSKFLARVYQMSLYFNSSHQAQTTKTTNFPTNICYTQGASMKIKFKVGYVYICFYYEDRTRQINDLLLDK